VLTATVTRLGPGQSRAEEGSPGLLGALYHRPAPEANVSPRAVEPIPLIQTGQGLTDAQAAHRSYISVETSRLTPTVLFALPTIVLPRPTDRS
jgi:hypothetical protein